MRNYGKVAATFWIRGTGRKLRGHPASQVLALYLMTCQSGTMCGVFYLPLVTLGHDTGIPADLLHKTLSHLAQVDFAHYDEDEELVWVPAMAHHQVGDVLKPGDKRRIALLEEIQKHGRHRFVGMFWERYLVPYNLDPRLRHAPSAGVADMPHAMPHGMGHPEAAPDSSMPHRSQSTSTNTITSTSSPDQLTGPAAPTQIDEPKPRRSRGRAARTIIPSDWQPTTADAALVTAAGLDVRAVVADFVGYWRNDGKLGADWAAAFRNNLAKIQRTDWLKAQFALPPQPLRLVGPASQPPSGPPAPAPEGLIDRMRAFAEGQRSPLLAADPERRAVAGSPSTFLDHEATTPASGVSNGVLGDPDAVTGVRPKPGAST